MAVQRDAHRIRERPGPFIRITIASVPLGLRILLEKALRLTGPDLHEKPGLRPRAPHLRVLDARAAVAVCQLVAVEEAAVQWCLRGEEDRAVKVRVEPVVLCVFAAVE